VSGSIKNVQIFAGGSGEMASNNSEMVENDNFKCIQCFRSLYVRIRNFGTFRDKAKIIMR